jgi:hypothetical protein
MVLSTTTASISAVSIIIVSITVKRQDSVQYMCYGVCCNFVTILSVMSYTYAFQI